MEARSRLGPLAERQFALLYAGQAVSLLGDALVPIALSFAVLDLTGSATDLGFVLAAQVIPLAVFVLAGGVWADRLPRQLVMLGSDAVRAVVQAVLAALLLSGRAELWHVIALAAAYGAAEAFFRPAATGLIPATVSPDRLQQANALLAMTANGSRIVGPALAGVLVATAGPGVAIAFDAGTFVVSALFLLRLRPVRAERATAGRTSFLSELGGGWSEFRSRTWLWVTVAATAFYLFGVIAPVQVLGPLIAKEHLGGASGWALIAIGGGAGAVVGSTIAFRWRPARPLFACALIAALVAPSLILLAVVAPLPAIVAAQFVAGLAMGLFSTVWETTLQREVPEDKLSRVSSYDWMGSIAFLPAGYALAGPLSDAIGVPATLWCSVGVLVVTLGLMVATRDIRELRSRPATAHRPEPMAA